MGVSLVWGILVLLFPATRIETAMGYLLLAAGTGAVVGAATASRGTAPPGR